jgi:hypothetical protein
MIDFLLRAMVRLFYRFEAVHVSSDDKTAITLSLRIRPRFGWSPLGTFGK